FDLYYRENCKTRPDWAPDPSGYKEMTRTYCANGKMSHLEPFHYHFPEKRELGADRLPVRRANPCWVIFHYDDRDPLDHQARVEYVGTSFQ
ncbi:MAG: B12-binding domain-containing radical SAM protein, partial [Lachnospiraceae bacterium]|nr:B12-binding domain-containing radical SAM protein [Lachnospiraceae bacterium]